MSPSQINPEGDDTNFKENLMMPAPQSPSPSSMGAPSPMSGGGMPPEQGGGDIKSMLIQVLTKAKSMAESNGLDFEALVSEVGGGETEEVESEAPSSPVPPSPSALQGM